MVTGNLKKSENITDENAPSEEDVLFNQLNPQQQATIMKFMEMLDSANAEKFKNEMTTDLLENNGVNQMVIMQTYMPLMIGAGSDEGRQVTSYDEDGNSVGYENFETHFADFPISGIIDNANSVDEIIAFQAYLENSGVVPKGTFDNTRGQYSDLLMGVVQDIMDYTDANFSVTPNSPEYKDLEKQPPLKFFLSQEDDEYDMQRKIFNFGVEQYVKDTKFLKEKETEAKKKEIEGELFQQAIKNYPTDDEFVQLMEDALEGSGIRVTDEILDAASTAFAIKHSKQFDDNLTKLTNFQESDIYAMYVEGTNVKREDVLFGGSVATEKRLNQDWFKEPMSAESFVEEYTDDKFGVQKTAAELGQEKIDVQNKILPHIMRYLTP